MQFCAAGCNPLFFLVLGGYITAGLTDMTDGTVAKVLHQESSFGAKLDTAADICFALYLLPLVSSVLYFQYGAADVCILAAFAAIQELLLLFRM